MLDETDSHIAATEPVERGDNVVPLPRVPDERLRLLNAYSEWLFYERRLLCIEIHPGVKGADGFVPQNTGASEYHFPMHPQGWNDQPQPSTRAAAVLGLVGCDWLDRNHRSSDPDPILALIEVEAAAYERFEGAMRATDNVRTGREPTPEEEAEYDLALNASDEAVLAVMSARPTTQAGMNAKLDLLIKHEGPRFHPDFVLALIESLRSTPVFPGSDPVLTALGSDLAAVLARKAEFERTTPPDWKGENPHYDEDWRLREAMDREPASSLAGLAAKARAAMSAREWDVEIDCRGAGSFVGLATSIITDIERLASGAVVEPDPVDTLFSQWQETQQALEELPAPETNDGDESSPCMVLCRRIWAIEERIENALPSAMRAAAGALIELSYDAPSDLTPSQVSRKSAEGDWLALHVLASLRPSLFGRVAEAVARILDNPDRPIDPAGTLASRPRAAAPLLQAAE